jgi:ParB family chromosome partitioning protein
MALHLQPVANEPMDFVQPGDFVTLDPNEVEIGERLRDIDPVWAEAIGLSMQKDGQIHAIHVAAKADGGWVLAGPGGHRLTGARMIGIAIDAKVVSPDALGQRRREAAENVFRRKNDPIERAASIAELVRVHKLARGIDPTKDGRSASVQARWQRVLQDEAIDTNATIALVYGWADEVAEQVGLSRRTVENDLLLYRRLAPSLVARLRGVRHPLLGNAGQLRALAKLEPTEQDRVVDQLLDTSAPAKSVSDAQARFRGANKLPSDPEAKRLSAFIGTFQRMGLAEKKGALSELLPLLPAGTVLSNVEGKTAKDVDAQRVLYEGEVRDGLKAAFELLLRLSDGEPVEDDEINAARAKTQMALVSVNSGFCPAPGGEA